MNNEPQTLSDEVERVIEYFTNSKIDLPGHDHMHYGISAALGQRESACCICAKLERESAIASL